MNVPHITLVKTSAPRDRLNNFDAFSHHLQRHHSRKSELTKVMANADYTGRPLVHYQPKVNLRTGHVHGVEALARWNSLSRGLISPDEFLPLVREKNALRSLDLVIMGKAVAQAVKWQQISAPLIVSVNVSPQHFHDLSFADDVISILNAYSEFDPACLAIEILESLEITDLPTARSVINRLRARGVLFYMDDFGTGHSAAAYLKHLPLDAIKIDQMFVRDLGKSTNNRQDLAIVRAAVDMANAFGISVIAEGIETDEAAVELLKIGCYIGQGYGIARPMSAEDFEVWHINRTTVTGQAMAVDALLK